MRTYLAWIALICWTSGAFAQTPQSFRVEGIVREKGTQQVLIDASLFLLLPAPLKSMSNEKGFFSFSPVPRGNYELVVNVPGHAKYTREIVVDKNISSLKIYLQKLEYGGSFETTTVASEKKRDPTQRSISANDFLTQAGGGQDPVRSVQNLSGINRSSGFNAQVVIQGSAPEQTTYLLDGHEVPFIFHFFGLNTVVFPESVDAVDTYSAGYGPENSRALGGLVNVKTRSPRTDQWRGIGYADTINAGVLAEGPIGKNQGLILSVRQSYIGNVLKPFLKDDSFSFTTVPRYSDLAAIYEYKPSEKHRLKITGVGSLDSVKAIVKESNDAELLGVIEQDTKFFKLISQYFFKPNEKYEGDFSLGFGSTKFGFKIGDNFLSIKSWDITPKAEWRFLGHPSFSHFIGMDHKISFTQADLRLPSDYSAGGVFNPFSSGRDNFVDDFRVLADLGFYYRGQWKSPKQKWILSPGVRLDYFQETGKAYPDPRLNISYSITPSLTLHTSGGRYRQAPEPREVSDKVGNPDLNGLSAWHLKSSIEKKFDGKLEGLSINAGTFFRWSEDLVVQSKNLVVKNGEATPEYYINSGTGKAFGGEVTLRYHRNRWTGTLAYTLLRSRLKEPGLGEYPNPYDQTHNLNFLGSVELPRNWKISTRLRWVSGNPYTPIIGTSYDSDNNVFIPERGTYYSKRLGSFFQLDARVDKRFVFNRWILSLYLDIQNATNRKNQEGLNYSFDYRENKVSKGLPIIPSLGIKGEF